MGITNKGPKNLGRLDEVLEPALQAGRIPGAAIAIVSGGETVFARGYGYRDLGAKLPVTSQTFYPIASTTKAINATLLGMLVEEGRLAWDAPVQRYMPEFRLGDPLISAQVTISDLIVMRTGLPRHDWVWIEHPTDRADLVRRLAFLELSAGFRERFQYNNMTAVTAGHIAEVVTGRQWEVLVREKVLEPLGMSNSGFTLPEIDNVSLSYHENSRRELVLTHRLASELVAPSGGAIHSTVEDMAHWVAFNLGDGEFAGRRLVAPETLKEIHLPHVLASIDQGAPSQNASYALGWFIDSYNGHPRVSHAGYLHDVHSSVMLFPADDLGIVSFTNFGGPRLAGLINQYTFDLLRDLKPAQLVEERLSEYERKIEETRARNAGVRRVENTSPSHPLGDYAGSYVHAGYGAIGIRRCGQELRLDRNNLELPLEHWHYDAWIAKDNDLFAIDGPHAFDRASRILFETNADGEIDALSIRLEPAVAPICFEKH